MHSQPAALVCRENLSGIALIQPAASVNIYPPAPPPLPRPRPAHTHPPLLQFPLDTVPATQLLAICVSTYTIHTQKHTPAGPPPSPGVALLLGDGCFYGCPGCCCCFLIQLAGGVSQVTPHVR
jgi:hypothetical protein